MTRSSRLPQPDFTVSYKDLAGKVLAIGSVGNSDEFVIKLLLRRENIPLSDVQLIPLGAAHQRAQALVGGQAQFAVLNPDLAVGLEQRGFNILGDVREALPIPWSGFAVHQDTIGKQPEMLKAWIRASLRTLQFMKQNPVETAEIAARELNLDRDLARRALDPTLPAMSDDDPGGFAERGLVLNTQIEMDLLGMTGDPAELGKNAHDLSLLRQVQRELGIRCVGGYQCP